MEQVVESFPVVIAARVSLVRVSVVLWIFLVQVKRIVLLLKFLVTVVTFLVLVVSIFKDNSPCGWRSDSWIGRFAQESGISDRTGVNRGVRRSIVGLTSVRCIVVSPPPVIARRSSGVGRPMIVLVISLVKVK